MTILSRQTIHRLNILEPYTDHTQEHDLNYDLNPTNYDLHLILNN